MVVAALAALALTSCTKDKQDTTPTTTKPPPTTTGTSSIASSAPPVDHPLDASAFVANPCASLTEEQRRQFNITGTDPGTESCFFAVNTTDSFIVAFDSSGLTSLYETHAQNPLDNWQPAEIDGYPAIAASKDSTSTCRFSVGVSDSLHFYVLMSNDGACADSKTVASAVLANIKAAN